MRWKEEIKKEESAKDYVLNSAKTGKSMSDALKEFAQKFPDKAPPQQIIEESIKRAEEMDRILAELDVARERMDAANNRKNPYE